MSEVTLIPVFDIKPGRTDDFRIAAARIIERTNQEPGTLRYQQFLSADGLRCVNIEVFADADAFVVHNRNVADLVGDLFAAGPVVHLDVIGEVNDALRDELGFANTSYCTLLGSIER